MATIFPFLLCLSRVLVSCTGLAHSEGTTRAGAFVMCVVVPVSATDGRRTYSGAVALESMAPYCRGSYGTTLYSMLGVAGHKKQLEEDYFAFRIDLLPKEIIFYW